jgi:hypothetical protein
MIDPLIKPTTNPAATAPPIAMKAPCGLKRANTTLDNAATAPTERSMPPVMITNVMPSAMRPNIAL